MKSGDKDTYKVINSIIAEIKNQMINNMTRDEEPSQDMVISTLKKMVKMRVDAKKQFKNASRIDLAEKEASQIEIINSFLPETLNKTETEKAILDIITQNNLTKASDIGIIMGKLKSQFGQNIDMAIASQISKEKLANSE